MTGVAGVVAWLSCRDRVVLSSVKWNWRSRPRRPRARGPSTAHCSQHRPRLQPMTCRRSRPPVLVAALGRSSGTRGCEHRHITNSNTSRAGSSRWTTMPCVFPGPCLQRCNPHVPKCCCASRIPTCTRNEHECVLGCCLARRSHNLTRLAVRSAPPTCRRSGWRCTASASGTATLEHPWGAG
jgi:hypothetical protein